MQLKSSLMHKYGRLPTAYCASVLLDLARGVDLSGIQLLTHDSNSTGLSIGISSNCKVVSISHVPDTRKELVED